MAPEQGQQNDGLHSIARQPIDYELRKLPLRKKAKSGLDTTNAVKVFTFKARLTRPKVGAVATRQTIGSAAIHAAITQIAESIVAKHGTSRRLIILGIANGGLPLSRRLTARINAIAPKLPTALGTLDISFHRDDIGRNPIPKEFTPTVIPGDVNGATVILIDDVLFSCRTVKAALDELFDHGRPAKVELAVLADRGGHLLPIHADYIGITLEDVPDTARVVIRIDDKHPSHDSIRIESPKL